MFHSHEEDTKSYWEVWESNKHPSSFGSRKDWETLFFYPAFRALLASSGVNERDWGWWGVWLTAMTDQQGAALFRMACRLPEYRRRKYCNAEDPPTMVHPDDSRVMGGKYSDYYSDTTYKHAVTSLSPFYIVHNLKIDCVAASFSSNFLGVLWLALFCFPPLLNTWEIKTVH